MVGIHVRSAFDSIVLDARCTRENIAAIKIVDRPVMAESRLLKTSYVGVLTPETSDRDSTRRQGLYGGDRVQTRSLAWTLRQQDCRPYEKRRLGYRLTAGWQGRRRGEKTPRSGNHPCPSVAPAGPRHPGRPRARFLSPCVSLHFRELHVTRPSTVFFCLTSFTQHRVVLVHVGSSPPFPLSTSP